MNIAVNKISYGNILRNVSLSVGEGEVVALMGPNGSGKTTLLGCLSGDLLVSGGSRSVDGLSARERARLIAYVEQDAPRSELSVWSYVGLGRLPYRSLWQIRESVEDEEMIRDALRMTGIEKLGGRSMNSLSGGERQLAHIARAVAQDSRFILLDEPSSGLDLRNEEMVLDLVLSLRQSGRGILCVMHNPRAAFSVADRVVYLRGGEVFAEGDVEAMREARLVNDVFGLGGVMRW